MQEISRDDLIRLVSDPSVDEAGAVCATALREGAAFSTFPEHERPAELVATYARRSSMAAKRGVPTVGGDDLVARISGEDRIAVGMVNGRQHNIAVFLVDDAARCAACWAIPNDWHPAE